MRQLVAGLLVCCALSAACARARPAAVAPAPPAVQTPLPLPPPPAAPPPAEPATAPQPEAAPAPQPVSVAVDFTSDVRPILARRCTPCHEPGGRMYERMPFDNPQTIRDHPEGVLRRIKEPAEKATLEAFLKGPSS